MKIYTKKGDTGTTALFGGTRVPKHHLRIESYGTVDELNAYVGLLADQDIEEHYKKVLREIQDRLFTIGSNLAADPSKDNLITPDIRGTDIALLEEEMDTMDAALPELKNFILPGGHTIVSYSHLARCVCRRAERQAVALKEVSPVPEEVIQYLNRLSDYLFVLGRKLAQDQGVQEVVWSPRK